MFALTPRYKVAHEGCEITVLCFFKPHPVVLAVFFRAVGIDTDDFLECVPGDKVPPEFAFIVFHTSNTTVVW